MGNPAGDGFPKPSRPKKKTAMPRKRIVLWEPYEKTTEGEQESWLGVTATPEFEGGIGRETLGGRALCTALQSVLKWPVAPFVSASSLRKGGSGGHRPTVQEAEPWGTSPPPALQQCRIALHPCSPQWCSSLTPKGGGASPRVGSSFLVFERHAHIRCFIFAQKSFNSATAFRRM